MRFLSPYSPPLQASPEEIDMSESPHHSISGRSSPWVVVHESRSAWASPPSISPHLLRDISPFLGYTSSPHQLLASEERTDPERASPGRTFPTADQRGLQPFYGYFGDSESHLGPENLRSQTIEPGLNISGVEYSNGMNWRSSMSQSQGFATGQRHLSTPVLGSSQQFPVLASMRSSPHQNHPCRYSPWVDVVRANHGQERAEPVTVKPEQVMEEGTAAEPGTPESFFPENLSEPEGVTDPFEDTTLNDEDTTLDDENDVQDACSNDARSDEMSDSIVRSKELSNTDMICLVCNRKFGRRHNLLTHLETHNPNRRLHKCQYCQSTFTRAKDRDRHIITIHDRSDKFKCTCGRGFPRKDSLNRHKATGCDTGSKSPLPLRPKKPKSPSPKPIRKQQTRRKADKSDGKKKAQRRKYPDPQPPTNAPVKQEAVAPPAPPPVIAHLRLNDHSWATANSQRLRSSVPVPPHGPNSFHRDFYATNSTVLRSSFPDHIKQEDSDSSGGYESDHDNRSGAPNRHRNDQGPESSWNYKKCHF